jgi:hypothetical protein
VRALSRRGLLRGAGSAALAVPFVRGALAAPVPGRFRLIVLMQTNGTSQGNFWPSADLAPGSSPILAPLLSDPVLRARTTVIKGLFDHDAGAVGNAHDIGFAGLWSGYRTRGTFFDPWGGGISIDQLLEQSLPLPEPHPTINCGVLASSVPNFKAHRASFSYRGPARQVPTQTDIMRLYATVFAPLAGTGADANLRARAEQRLRQQRSVLDYVAADLRALRGRVDGAERDKLDAHAEALRSFETRLGRAADPAPEDAARCAAVAQPQQRLDLADEANVPELVRLMLDFIAAAAACNLTRIVTFQFGNAGEQWRFGWLGINENSHADIAHRDDGKNPVVTAKLIKMNVWYAEQVAHLARALGAIPEGNGTALDNTLIVWGNEQATGTHGLDDIPVVFLGRAAGRLGRTGVLVDAGPQDYHRLGTSVLGLMGVPATGFGEQPRCGPLQGLTVV